MSDTSPQTSNQTSIIDPNGWTLQWLPASICSCLWRGGKQDSPITSLWKEMLDEPNRLNERLKSPKRMSDASSLVAKIKDVAQANSWAFQSGYGWGDSEWDERMKVGAATWGDKVPKIKDGWSLEPGHTPIGAGSNVLTVLRPNGLFVTMEGFVGHPSEAKVEFEVRAQRPNRRTVNVGRRGEPLDTVLDLPELEWDPTSDPPKSTDFWLDPYLEVVDNRLLNRDANFRTALQNAGSSNTRAIQNIIEQAAHGIGFLNFHSHFPPLSYVVDPDRDIKHSTIAWKDEEYHVTLGLQGAGRKKSAEERAVVVPDWPCGALYDPGS